MLIGLMGLQTGRRHDWWLNSAWGGYSSVRQKVGCVGSRNLCWRFSRRLVLLLTVLQCPKSLDLHCPGTPDASHIRLLKAKHHRNVVRCSLASEEKGSVHMWLRAAMLGVTSLAEGSAGQPWVRVGTVAMFTCLFIRPLSP